MEYSLGEITITGLLQQEGQGHAKEQDFMN